MTSEQRREAFLTDLVSVCRKHRVMMDEPEDWDACMDPITLREYPKQGEEFIVDAGDLERVLREELWDELHND